MESSNAIIDALQATYAASSAGDLAAIEALISTQPGTTMIGTDPDEWWEGPAVLHAWRAQTAAMGGHITITAGDPVGSREGSVGWVADRPTLHLPDGSTVTFRLSAVFHEDDGAWKVVSSHASVGVPNEDVVGAELPS